MNLFSSLLFDNQLITNGKQISNHFKNFFTSIAEKINRNITLSKQKKLTFLILALKTVTQFSFSNSTGGPRRPNMFNENKHSKWSK